MTDAALLALGDAVPSGPFGHVCAVVDAARPEMAESRTAIAFGALHRELLRVRAAAVGPLIDATARCPTCDESLSLDIVVADLIDHQPAVQPLRIERDGIRVTGRVPTLGDLLAVADLDSVAAARSELIRRVVTAHRGDIAMDVNEVPADVIGEMASMLDSADPLADLQFALQCVECGSDFVANFDVGPFVHTELAAKGGELVYEIDALAMRYGWTEDQILAIPERRRRRYLELAG